MGAPRLLLVATIALASCGSTAASPADPTATEPTATEPTETELPGTELAGEPATAATSPTDQLAFETFLTALGRGDRALAETVATSEALAADDWLGYDGLPNQAKPGHLTDAEGTLDGTTATYLLAPGRRLVCELDDGLVVRCTPGE